MYCGLKRYVYYTYFAAGKISVCTDSASSNTGRYNDVGKVKYEIEMLAAAICTLGPSVSRSDRSAVYVSAYSAARHVGPLVRLVALTGKPSSGASGSRGSNTHPASKSLLARPEGVRGSRPALPEHPNCRFKEMYCTDSIYRVYRDKLQNYFCNYFK